MEKECPFCELNKEKTRVIWEGEKVFVVLSNPRLMKGHILVIPKRHVGKISELDEEEREELFKTVLDFQERILGKIAKGCDIVQNYRPFQKEGRLKVYHLHVHLRPRELFDELYEKSQIHETGIFRELDENEKDEVAGLLSKE
ncbi:MAG: HIT domain-containing protein [Nanoarchaeota archaeon]